MRTATIECKHCGVEYTHQYSGSYDVVDTPKEYRSSEHCPECQKAIFDALNNIPIKFEWKFIPTTEVSLEQLIEWENIPEEEQKYGVFGNEIKLPIAKRVFPTLYSTVNNEHQKASEVIGRDDKEGRVYIYCYWPSKPEEAVISVKKRINIGTGEEIGYFIKR